MKRLTSFLILVLFVIAVQAQRAKYVFYFIGDGMGLNQVNATEMYLAEQEGRIGIKPLQFPSFPVAGMATTFSKSNSITDSSAAGTALATGTKTYNGALGVDADKNAVYSVAVKAQQAGKKVGIATSVGIDHATPGAFYAHQPDRNMYYEISLDLAKTGFDFYAGSGFNCRDTQKIFAAIEQAGYTIARGTDEYKEKCDDAQKMLLIQEEGYLPFSLPYAIDRKEGDLTLAQITESAIDFLTEDNHKGFFLMVEGGKIDWACHDNDPATVVNEVIDFDNAIKVAYEFYQKHPKETLIVVTADHETGGLGLGNSDYTLNLKALGNQQQSSETLSRDITTLRKNENATWENMKDLLSERMGFWDKLSLTWEQERLLHNEFDQSFVQHKVVFAESLYSKTEPVAAAARKVMSQIAKLGWTSGSHTAEYVPVFAIGANAKLFSGKMDNTDIPKRIAKAAGYKW